MLVSQHPYSYHLLPLLVPCSLAHRQYYDSCHCFLGIAPIPMRYDMLLPDSGHLLFPVDLFVKVSASPPLKFPSHPSLLPVNAISHASSTPDRLHCPFPSLLCLFQIPSPRHRSCHFFDSDSPPHDSHTRHQALPFPLKPWSTRSQLRHNLPSVDSDGFHMVPVYSNIFCSPLLA